jgi:hypothetical protein
MEKQRKTKFMFGQRTPLDLLLQIYMVPTDFDHHVSEIAMKYEKL